MGLDAQSRRTSLQTGENAQRARTRGMLRIRARGTGWCCCQLNGRNELGQKSCGSQKPWVPTTSPGSQSRPSAVAAWQSALQIRTRISGVWSESPDGIFPFPCRSTGPSPVRQLIGFRVSHPSSALVIVIPKDGINPSKSGWPGRDVGFEAWLWQNGDPLLPDGQPG